MGKNKKYAVPAIIEEGKSVYMHGLDFIRKDVLCQEAVRPHCVVRDVTPEILCF